MALKRRVVKTRLDFVPFTDGDGRIIHHVTGHDFFGDGYGGAHGIPLDRERMLADWQEHAVEIIERARREFPHETSLWSEREFGTCDE